MKGGVYRMLTEMITFARFCYLNGYLNFKYGKCGVLFG